MPVTFVGRRGGPRSLARMPHAPQKPTELASLLPRLPGGSPGRSDPGGSHSPLTTGRLRANRPLVLVVFQLLGSVMYIRHLAITNLGPFGGRRNFDQSLKRGSVGIFGRNGRGKSTLIN